MANTLKRVTGQASVAGESIITVPAGSTFTIIGCRAANIDTEPHTVHFTINDVAISGLDTPLPYGSAIDVMVGSKIVAEEGDEVKAYADDDSVVDVYISYLEQSTD